MKAVGKQARRGGRSSRASGGGGRCIVGALVNVFSFEIFESELKTTLYAVAIACETHSSQASSVDVFQHSSTSDFIFPAQIEDCKKEGSILSLEERMQEVLGSSATRAQAVLVGPARRARK